MNLREMSLVKKIKKFEKCALIVRRQENRNVEILWFNLLVLPESEIS